ncbi:MAG: hypothetical protein Kow0022_11500 [Phycisphaerales bacterium]
MNTATLLEHVLIDPEPEAWGGLIVRPLVRPAWVDAVRFREQMGIAGEGPLVLSGHQAGLWHAGIAAKYFALAALQSRVRTAWLVADLDDNEPTKLRIPVQDRRGVWQAEWVELADGPGGHPDASCGFRPVIAVRKDVPERARRAARAMEAAGEGSADLAEQAHRAVEIVLEEAGLAPVRPVIRGSMTARTELFRQIVQRMCEDPRSCVEAYNAAAQAFPEAGVRLLMCRTDRGRFEMPLWRLGWNEPRMPVIVQPGQKMECQGLAPRGLLMTGMLRLAGCELFIHGTGGGLYDRVTERWLRDWLGADVMLAPAAVVSATRLLDLGVEPVDPGQVAHLVAAAHRARHEPAMLGDAEAARRKRELVERIGRAARHSPERAAAFRAMHELLHSTVSERAEVLSALEQRARRAREALASSAAARDRTWSIALHDPEQLRALADAVSRAMEPVRLPS